MKRIFGELELAIMQVIKEASWSSIHDIQKALKRSDKYTTVLTVTTRLFDKGYLIRKKEGRYYLYCIKEKSKPYGFLEKIKDKLFMGKTSALICHLIDSENIKEQELVEIEKLIKKVKKEKKK